MSEQMSGQMTTAEHTQEQYADESRLSTRLSVWQPAADGRDPVRVALSAVVDELASLDRPGVVVEAGCGTASFAARVCAAVPSVSYLATDASARMVELARAQGVPAAVADAADLPVEDAAADVVVANWMLYHVPDLDAAIAELHRVLRPGGLLVAATNGDEHLAELLLAACGARMVTQFSTENGAEALGRHFREVQQVDVRTRAVFADHAAAQAYIDTFSEPFEVPPFEGGREYAGATTVFTAR